MPQDGHPVGLPPRVFLYTVDQLAVILSVTEKSLHQTHLHHEGRDIGRRESDQMLARNIARRGDKPDWRVAEKELIRWLRGRGFKYYDKGTVTN